MTLATRSPEDLLSVDDARERIVSAVSPLDSESCSLSEALGRVLAEPVISDLEVPPFANSAMDGFAIRSMDTTGGGSSDTAGVELTVVHEIAAGSAHPG